jgi:hypothetical protein
VSEIQGNVNISQTNLYGGQAQKGPSQVAYPGLSKNRKNPKHNPTIAPTGGYYTLQNLTFTQPLSALVNNYYVSSKRATGTIPEEAMTQDVHSYWWDLR